MNKVKCDGKVAVIFRVGRMTNELRNELKVMSMMKQSRYAVTMLNYPKPTFTRVPSSHARLILSTSK